MWKLDRVSTSIGLFIPTTYSGRRLIVDLYVLHFVFHLKVWCARLERSLLHSGVTIIFIMRFLLSDELTYGFACSNLLNSYDLPWKPEFLHLEAFHPYHIMYQIGGNLVVLHLLVFLLIMVASMHPYTVAGWKGEAALPITLH